MPPSLWYFVTEALANSYTAHSLLYICTLRVMDISEKKATHRDCDEAMVLNLEEEDRYDPYNPEIPLASWPFKYIWVSLESL